MQVWTHKIPILPGHVHNIDKLELVLPVSRVPQRDKQLSGVFQ